MLLENRILRQRLSKWLKTYFYDYENHQVETPIHAKCDLLESYLQAQAHKEFDRVLKRRSASKLVA